MIYMFLCKLIYLVQKKVAYGNYESFLVRALLVELDKS